MRRTNEYEIRLYRGDGTLSMVLACVANRDAIAEQEAVRMLNGELTKAQILHNYKLIRTFDYVDGLAVVS